MLFLKRGLMAAGALALAAMLLNFVAPNEAHAIVATAVQVMNTSSAPVLTRDVDAAGRNAYVLSCAASSNSCWTASVPTGSTFVVDAISLLVHSSTGTPQPTAWVNFYPPPTGALVQVTIPLTPTLGYESVYVMNLTAYAAAGTQLAMVTGSAGYVYAIFTGHLVSTP